MALQVLAINGTAGESAEFTLDMDTLVWVHGARSSNCSFGLDIKGSDGLFSPLTDMDADGVTCSGVLPAGDYRVTRLRGVCGFQQAA